MSSLNHNDISLVDPNLLPPQIRRFVAIIGMAETVKLLKEYGGLPVKFTGTCAWLQGVINDEAIKKLITEFKDQELSLPKFDKVFTQLRNMEIMESLKNKSGRQVAKDNCLTYRMIKIIKNKQQEENPTGDLFS